MDTALSPLAVLVVLSAGLCLVSIYSASAIQQRTFRFLRYVRPQLAPARYGFERGLMSRKST